jgi:undecaprenyl-diphosphatase
VIHSPTVPPTLLQSAVLGLVQGLTEFLPISSSAHLILVPYFLHWEDPGLSFDVALHLGTLVGVLAYFWRDFWDMLTLPDHRKTLGFLIVATIPGAIFGLLFEHKAEDAFRSPHLIAWALIVMGALLALADRKARGLKSIPDLTWTDALIIGISQALALIPGVSRSGITITTALALGYKREEAARFSFLMSAPIIAGAGILKMKAILMAPDKAALGAGFICSALAGFLAICALMKFVQTRSYMPFAVYRWILGLFVLLHS